jgi:phospholipase/lecithinase/hemolysin
MRTLPHRSLASAIVASSVLLLFASSSTAFAQGSSQVVVFGDSLSDPGNGFSFVKSSATPPDYMLNSLLIPSAPYARGGHHLTNGSTWIEQLAGALRAERSVLPAFVGSNPHAMNFAIGTARARDDGSNPSLSFEVASFLQKTGGVASPDALYVIQIGGNDVRDAIATGDPVQGVAILQAAATAIANNISLLYSGIDIIPFDANALITAIVNNPGLYGLTNVTDACVTPNVPPFTCQTPDEYLFWDGIHATAAAHTLVAQAVALLLGL